MTDHDSFAFSEICGEPELQGTQVGEGRRRGKTMEFAEGNNRFRGKGRRGGGYPRQGRVVFSLCSSISGKLTGYLPIDPCSIFE